VDFDSQNFIVYNNISDRICPHCDKKLETIQLPLGEPLYIERCKDCFGLFFDVGELDILLEHSVKSAQEINSIHLKNINIDRYYHKQDVKYIKCPVCQRVMDRNLFAKKSGVVVDRCIYHGLWLESGEITHLMEWKKAGGELLHKQYLKNDKKKEKPTTVNIWTQDIHESSVRPDVIDMISWFFSKLF
jgi:Zn-finger nucleic acid-binding protein